MQSNFWAGSKKFGQAQNILGPVKGQGITIVFSHSQVLTERKSSASFVLTPPFHVNTWTGTWQVLMRVAVAKTINIFAENVLSVATLWII